MNEDIVIIEDEGAGQSTPTPTIDDEALKQKARRKKILIISAASALLLIGIGVGLYVTLAPEPTTAPPTEKPKKETTHSDIATQRSSIEELIEKANLLYKRGDKEKALQIFEEIAQFNEALSHYNLGVAKMKEGAWAEALELFDKALASGEHRTPAALNAAVCAKQLGNQEAFKHYLDIAEAALPETAGTKLYSYYYALLRYYQGRPIETLAAATKPTSNFFMREHLKIGAQMANLLDDSALAIKFLEAEKNPQNELPLGLLYARLANYDEAAKHLDAAERYGLDPLRTLMAQALVHLKRNKFPDAALALERASLKDEANASRFYAIKTILKESLFDIDKGQRDFQKNFLLDRKTLYATLFYYAPFKIFNPNKTVADIKKGQLELLSEESAQAMAHLEHSARTSNINGKIAQGIKMALGWHITPAYKLFKELESRTTGHSILQYNLGLTYAQLGNYPMAYKHFLRAYHFDRTNYLAGIFTIICGELTNNDTRRIVMSLREDLQNSATKDNETLLYLSMLYYFDNNLGAAARWFDQSHDKEGAFERIFEILLAQKQNDAAQLKRSAAKLHRLLPKDILSNILYAYISYQDRPIKEFAYRAQELLKGNQLDLSSLYYGPVIVPALYVRLGFLTGLLPGIEQKLKARVRLERYDVENGLRALALAQIYLKKFEESYANYSHLIDALKVGDAQTVFQASVAAMASGRHAEAIGYLELAKALDPYNLESRVGLGLLYIEAGNLKAAANAFKVIDDKNFVSDYFDFIITN
ncbi:MAG: tetratricopeptide repeat protein [Campylobacterales bacterium]